MPLYSRVLACQKPKICHASMHSLITDESIWKNKLPSLSFYILLIVPDKVIFIAQKLNQLFYEKVFYPSTLILLL
jgi:hypothetical protein